MFGRDSKINETTSERPTTENSGQAYTYEGRIVTANEWIQENILNDFFGKVKRYFISLFPIFSWIYRYNYTWFVGGTINFLLTFHG